MLVALLTLAWFTGLIRLTRCQAVAAGAADCFFTSAGRSGVSTFLLPTSYATVDGDSPNTCAPGSR